MFWHESGLLPVEAFIVSYSQSSVYVVRHCGFVVTVCFSAKKTVVLRRFYRT
jgi:hypothetical protein